MFSSVFYYAHTIATWQSFIFSVFFSIILISFVFNSIQQLHIRKRVGHKSIFNQIGLPIAKNGTAAALLRA